MKVVVLGGGRSSEREVSLASARAVRDALIGAGHDVVEVEIDRAGRWIRRGAVLRIVPGGGVLEADVVFPVLHGRFGEDGTVQGLLEIADVAYVGTGVLGSAICLDKVRFKERMGHVGFAQAEYVVVHTGDEACEAARLGLPAFVKPASQGSSIGVSKVTADNALPTAVLEALRYGPAAIVERCVGGIEVECAVIGNSQPLASLPGEVVTRDDWCTYETKYAQNGCGLVIPPRLAVEVHEHIRALALDVFHAVGCAGLARVDFFVDDDRVLVNEVNTMPGLCPSSSMPQLLEASGWAYPDLLVRLLMLAIERHETTRRYRC
jgi:D-alanine-D-alanine ligase